MTREIIKSDRPPYGEPSFVPYAVPAYRGGDEGAWSPADLSGIFDYGIRNTSNMYTSRTTNSGVVANDGDLVGSWIGELGTAAYRSTADSFRPILGATGVRFTTAAAGGRILEEGSGALSFGADQPFALVMIQDIPGGGSYVDHIGYDLRAGTTIVHGWIGSLTGDQQGVRCRVTNTPVNSPADWTGRHYFGTVYNGTTAWHWTDETKTSITVGASADVITGSRFQNNNFPKDATVVGWIVVQAAISDADWDRIMTWGASL